MNNDVTTLKRTLSLSAMVFYGLGTIVGAGIYVLIGEISGQAGSWAPLAFLAAAFIASFTGLSYAELVARYPQSAGEAVYVQAAFQRTWLSQCVGWSVVLTGLVSAATLIKGFAGYYISLFDLSTDSSGLIIIVTMSLMCVLACSGVKQSVGVAVGITIIELVGLALVIVASGNELVSEANWHRWEDGLEHFSWIGISAATFLAFYAFIGFEDMVNMAEEVENATTTIPRAIVIAVSVSAIIYCVIALVAVVVVPVNTLATSSAPMATIVAKSSWFPAWLMILISLVAILNGAIVQLLMAPRVIYGLSQHSNRLHFLSRIHPKTQTPVVATIVVSVLIIVFSLALPLGRLAQLTSFIILFIFILINCALIVLKKREVFSGFTVALWVPILGVVTSLMLLIAQVIF